MVPPQKYNAQGNTFCAVRLYLHMAPFINYCQFIRLPSQIMGRWYAVCKVFATFSLMCQSRFLLPFANGNKFELVCRTSRCCLLVFCWRVRATSLPSITLFKCNHFYIRLQIPKIRRSTSNLSSLDRPISSTLLRARKSKNSKHLLQWHSCHPPGSTVSTSKTCSSMWPSPSMQRGWKGGSAGWRSTTLTPLQPNAWAGLRVHTCKAREP
jgi:hypothetical protein